MQKLEKPADLPLRTPNGPHRRAGRDKSCSFGSTPLICPLDVRAEEEHGEGKLQSYSVAALIYHLSLSLSKGDGDPWS